jgi:peroxiredoxin
VQLGKLREQIGRIRATGAEVFAISNDDREDASRMSGELLDDIRVLSDPSMRVIYRYGMKGERMAMADMGYVLIDGSGVIRARRIDPRFGDRSDEIVRVLGDASIAGGQ